MAISESPEAASGNLGNTGSSQSRSIAPVPSGRPAAVRNGRVVVRPQHFTADALAGRRLLAAKAARNSPDLSAAQALSEGFTPFVAGDAIKAVIAAGLLPGAWWLTGYRRNRTTPPAGEAG